MSRVSSGVSVVVSGLYGGACGACGVWVCFRSYFRVSKIDSEWGVGGRRGKISHLAHVNHKPDAGRFLVKAHEHDLASRVVEPLPRQQTIIILYHVEDEDRAALEPPSSSSSRSALKRSIAPRMVEEMSRVTTALPSSGRSVSGTE